MLFCTVVPACSTDVVTEHLRQRQVARRDFAMQGGVEHRKAAEWAEQRGITVLLLSVAGHGARPRDPFQPISLLRLQLRADRVDAKSQVQQLTACPRFRTSIRRRGLLTPSSSNVWKSRCSPRDKPTFRFGDFFHTSFTLQYTSLRDVQDIHCPFRGGSAAAAQEVLVTVMSSTLFR